MLKDIAFCSQWLFMILKRLTSVILLDRSATSAHSKNFWVSGLCPSSRFLSIGKRG
jgi:hypothetical protein